MITETLIVCVTTYILVAPMAYAKAQEIRERAHKLELENDEREYITMNSVDDASDE